MFWLFLLLRPRHHHHHVRAHRRHARFRNPWYWLSMLAFMELAVWLAVFEFAGEVLGVWWLLWWAARKSVFFAGDHRSVPGGAYRFIDATRPVWPKAAG